MAGSTQASKHGRIRSHGCGYVPYFQYLFATIYLVFLAYAVYIWRSDRRLRLKELIAPAALIAILLSPLVWNSIYVHRTSSESSWAPSPDALELVSSFMPQVLAASILLGVLAGCFARGRGDHCRQNAAFCDLSIRKLVYDTDCYTFYCGPD